MQSELKREIKYLAQKKMRVRKQRRQKENDYGRKFAARTGLPQQYKKASPQSFPHKHFDPKHCIRHKNIIARAIWAKCLEGNYKPTPAILHELPKPGGGIREIMEFSIPDAALARVLFRRVGTRNLKKQSANSFAYRSDRNLFDALLKLRGAIDRPKVFVAQYDFEKFFDSIPHQFLYNIVNEKEIFTSTEIERKIIFSFMKHEYSYLKNYPKGYFERRRIGTPQGSSISLILANLANDPLDKELEKLNGQFVRYADDVVNIAYNYEDALRIEHAFHTHCRHSGIKLNLKKSEGISVLSELSQEIRNSESLKFLGYQISREGFAMSDSAQKKLKQKISNLLNLYLIRHPRKGQFNPRRVSKEFDWDLLGFISELRNIIYGGIPEKRIVNFLKTGKRPTKKKIRGYMSFYCLIDHGEILKELDGWLVYAILSVYKKREKFLDGLGLQYPDINKSSIISGSWYTPQIDFDGKGLFKPEVRLPSFIRGWRAARKFYYIFGLENVEKPKYLGYDYW